MKGYATSEGYMGLVQGRYGGLDKILLKWAGRLCM